MDSEPGVYDVAIAEGESMSDGCDFGYERLHRIDFPDAWTPAAVTLQAMSAEGVWRDVYIDTAEYVITAAGALRSVVVDQAVAFGIQKVRVRSGTAGAPVNQGAARTLKLATAPL